MFKDVLKRFSAISGLEGKELSKWSFLCTECLNYVLEHSIKDTLSESEGQSVCALASALAYHKLLLYDSERISSFNAGDISITRENALEKAEKMVNLEIDRCSGITDFGMPSFMGVRS